MITKKKLADFVIRYRMPLSLLIFGLLLLEDWNERLVPRHVFSLQDPIGFAASVLVVLGAFMRTWAAGTIHKTKQLATEGPYSLTRHPLYLGSLLIAVGFSLFLWDNENIWVVLVVAALLYLPKIRQEEAHLENLFGDQWREYRKRTGMFFPKRLPTLRSGWSLQQWRYNREYKTLFVCVAAMVVLKKVI